MAGTLLRRGVTTWIVAAVCAAGLAACGGSSTPKISDKSFITSCKNTLASVTSAVKAHEDEVCQCVQQQLDNKSLGDKDPNDKAVQPELRAASSSCLSQVLRGP